MSISKVLTKFIEARNGYAGISNESRRRYNSVLVAIILHGVIIYGGMILSWPYIKEEVSRKLFPPINLGAFIGLWIFNVLFFSSQSGLFGSTRGIFSDDKFDLYGKWSTFVKALYRKKFLELIAGNTLVIIPYILIIYGTMIESEIVHTIDTGGELLVGFYAGILSLAGAIYSVVQDLDTYVTDLLIDDVEDVLSKLEQHYIIIGYGPLQKSVAEQLANILEKKGRRYGMDIYKERDIILPNYEMAKMTSNLIVVTLRESETTWTLVTLTGDKIGLVKLTGLYHGTLRWFGEYIPVIIGDVRDEEIRERAKIRNANLVLATQRDVTIIDSLFPLAIEMGTEDKLWVLRTLSSPRLICSLPNSLTLNLHVFHLANMIGYNAATYIVPIYEYVLSRKESSRILIIGGQEADGREIFYLTDRLLADYEKELMTDVLSHGNSNENAFFIGNILIFGDFNYYESVSLGLDTFASQYDKISDKSKSILDACRRINKSIGYSTKIWKLISRKLTVGERTYYIPFLKGYPNYPTLKAVISEYNPDIIVFMTRELNKAVDIWSDIIHVIFSQSQNKENNCLPKLIYIVPQRLRLHEMSNESFAKILMESAKPFLPGELYTSFYEPIIHFLSGIFSSYATYDALNEESKIRSELRRLIYKEGRIIPEGYFSIGSSTRDIPLALVSLLAPFAAFDLKTSHLMKDFRGLAIVPSIRYDTARIGRGKSDLFRVTTMVSLYNLNDYLAELNEIFGNKIQLDNQRDRIKLF